MERTAWGVLPKGTNLARQVGGGRGRGSRAAFLSLVLRRVLERARCISNAQSAQPALDRASVISVQTVVAHRQSFRRCYYPPACSCTGVAGTGHSCDRVAHGRDQSQAPKQSQHSKTSDAHARSGASLPPPPPPAFNAASGADLSPSSGGKNGKGGGHAGLGAATKTIQSYFCKPANGSAVQNLAASYGAGDPAGPPNAPSVLPREVDLSGGDGQSQYCDAGYHVQPMAKVGRSSSSGRLGVGGGDSGRSLQHRVLAAEDQDVDQAQHGQGHAHGRVGHVGAMGGNGGKEGAQVRDAQEDIERLTAKLQEAEALATKLQKELDRANLERGSMESMVS